MTTGESEGDNRGIRPAEKLGNMRVSGRHKTKSNSGWVVIGRGPDAMRRRADPIPYRPDTFPATLDTRSNTANPPAAPVRVRLNKDGTASVEVGGATVAETLARLDEVGAGLTARGIPFGIDGAAQVANMAAESRGGPGGKEGAPVGPVEGGPVADPHSPGPFPLIPVIGNPARPGPPMTPRAPQPPPPRFRPVTDAPLSRLYPPSCDGAARGFRRCHTGTAARPSVAPFRGIRCGPRGSGLESPRRRPRTAPGCPGGP